MKKLIVLFLLIIYGFFVVEAQEQLKHEKRIFVSPKGRVYINKALPIYLSISTSPRENAPSYLLKSESTPRYANPMYLDTEGYNTFRAPSQVDTVTKKPVLPVQDIIYEVYADSKPPVTSIDYGNSKIYKSKGKTYISGSANILLKSKDELSGVENIYFSIDKETYQPYAQVLNLTQEKEYELNYYSVDNVGNVENVHLIVFVIDNKNPKTSLIIKGDVFDSILSERSQIVLQSDDGEGIGTREIDYILDNLPLKKYVGPVNAAYLKQGEHKITYYSVDNVGNTEQQQVYDFFVDKTPPTIVQEIVGKSFSSGGVEYSSGKSKLKITGFDNKAGIKEMYYSINGNEYQKYDKPFYLDKHAGNITIKAYALDNVNNKAVSVESGDKASLPFLDLSGPTVKHGFSGPVFIHADSVFINKKTSTMLTAYDSESGLERIEYVIGTGEFLVFSKPFSIENEGVYKIKVTGYDNVENSNSGEFSVTVDNTGPEIFYRFSSLSAGKTTINEKEIDTYPSYCVLFISSIDKCVAFDKIYYSLNNAPEKPYTSLINNFQKNTSYSIKVRSLDKLGNETISVLEFYVGE